MRHVFSLIAAGCILTLGFGCSVTVTPDNAKEKGKDTRPDVEGISQAELVKGNNQFAVELYARVGKEPGNLFVSPYSISTAMGMTYAGARTTTAEQMAKTLHFPADERRLHPTFAGLRKEILAGQGKGYEIQTANALWPQKGYGFRTEFTDTVRQLYNASVQEVDFVDAREPARSTINDWVAKETRDKIMGLLQPGDLTELTRLVLTNAIYFKGDWAAQFPKAGTQPRYFYRKNGDYVTTPQMAQCAEFPFWQDDTLQVAEFPYVGKHLSMVVVLPRSAEGLPAVEKTLSPEKLADWIGKLKTTKINVFLPRFKARTRLDLKEQLSALGMPVAFDRDNADFTGMTGTDPNKKLHISKVIHEAFVEINEEGTEAAGATAVIEEAKSAKGTPSVVVPPTFRADRPFLFVIRDTRSGSVLFMGRLADPSK
jgi:serpin B